MVRIRIITTSEDEGAPKDSRRANLKLSSVVKFQVLRLTLTVWMADDENDVLTDSREMQVLRGTGQWKRIPQGAIV